ncbi:hypothetical protein M3644_26735 [Bacillus cereus]|uniref:hypothetical protein n=1 Tax=Bacillus cereus TaxID=1396 RepID=UPI0020409D8A|nr:hypothetical protein [Bacillus cereus]MCM3223351.1 hypothetical protein [Bacillus cereus]
MNLQIGNKQVIPGQWVVCEMKDGNQITQVTKVIKDTIKTNKVEIWGYWHSEGSIKGEYGFNYKGKCRFATAEEIDEESWRQVFKRRGRIPGQFKMGDLVSDDVHVLTVMHQTGNRVTAEVVNSTREHEFAAEDLEPLFFKEDMVG